MEKKGKELIFMHRIANNGMALEKPKKTLIDLIQDDNFEVNCLSMTYETFIASGMSSFIVKLKPKIEVKCKECGMIRHKFTTK